MVILELLGVLRSKISQVTRRVTPFWDYQKPPNVWGFSIFNCRKSISILDTRN